MMIRKLKLFVALFLIILVSSISNEVINHKVFAEENIDIWDLFPAKKGKSWKYLSKTVNSKSTYTITIENEIQEGDYKIFEGTIIEDGKRKEEFKVYEEDDVLWIKEGKDEFPVLKRPIEEGTSWEYKYDDNSESECEIIDTSCTLKINGKVYENCVVTREIIKNNMGGLYSEKEGKYIKVLRYRVNIRYFCPRIGPVYFKRYTPEDLSNIEDYKKVKATDETILIK